jgi:hypothetical protein
VERFDCGTEPLNRFLVPYALQSQQSDRHKPCHRSLANPAAVDRFTVQLLSKARHMSTPVAASDTRFAQEPIPVDDALPLARYYRPDIANRNAAISSPLRTSRTSRTRTG